MADLFVEIDPCTYKSFVTKNSKGERVLICQCLNSIYDTVIACLLYYRKFRKTAECNGLTVNPYSPCVANRTVADRQQTICWHVDDCNLSHADPKANNDFIHVKQEYENKFEDGTGKMTIHLGKKLKYLRLELDCSTEGVCKITMPEYIQELLATWKSVAPEEKGTIDGAALKYLFAVVDKSVKLSPAKKEKFHSIVAKILFATKHARPDTGTAVLFLTMRVKCW